MKKMLIEEPCNITLPVYRSWGERPAEISFALFLLFFLKYLPLATVTAFELSGLLTQQSCSSELDNLEMCGLCSVWSMVLIQCDPEVESPFT